MLARDIKECSSETFPYSLGRWHLTAMNHHTRHDSVNVFAFNLFRKRFDLPAPSAGKNGIVVGWITNVMVLNAATI